MSPTARVATPESPARLAHRERADAPSPPRRTTPSPLRPSDALGRVEALMHALAGDDGCFCARMAREHLAAGGKRLRARLALAAAEALGASRNDAAPWAAACELLHNATLVHDDLQDGDAVRRGRPTTWARYGAAQAVNAGDLLLMLPFLAADRLPAPPDVRLALATALARAATETVRGQAAEMRLPAACGYEWDGWLPAVEGKTGALFQLPVEGAARLAGRDAASARALAAPFRRVGVLFQLQDDVLDLFGDKGRGAPGADLREGKVSALVVEHLELHPGDTAWLRGLLALPRDATPEAEVDRAIERFRSGGALRRVLDRVRSEAWSVAESPAFAAAPALGEVARELVCVALTPIGHLGQLTDFVPAVAENEETTRMRGAAG
ncbi:MAG TPA: polyprenyl synthetase family protein [Longimicrobium sp.]|nr:polyprenyl synthetase family protein [Longimicrobium sp.]